MQKITPFLWFDKEAGEAAKFYTSVFSDAKIISTTTLENTPSARSRSSRSGFSGRNFN